MPTAAQIAAFQKYIPEMSTPGQTGYLEPTDRDRWLDLARQFHDISSTATAYLAAHFATNTANADSGDAIGTASDGGDRVIVSERMGEQQVTYARPTAAAGNSRAPADSFFMSTRYGRTGWALAKQASVGAGIRVL